MALLVRLARQAELPEGAKLVKETHGRKVLLARTRGRVYATDAHCFHMGGNLWEGDIEDVGGHACVVCPMHRYKIDMATGHKVDTMLDGCVTCSSSQQQRTYRVSEDPDFIWIDIPELHSQQPLPSDRYNQVALPQPPASGTPGRGLFGSSSYGGPSAEALAPYAGFPQRRDMLPDTPTKGSGDEPALVLSQEAPQLAAQQAALQQQQAQQQQQQAQPHFMQAQIPFAQSRVDTARIARRKAATAAIAARSYMPPMAPAPAAPPARGLASNGTAPQRTGSGAGLARTASGAGSGGQASLLSFGFTVQPRPTAAGGDGDMMDMD